MVFSVSTIINKFRIEMLFVGWMDGAFEGSSVKVYEAIVFILAMRISPFSRGNLKLFILSISQLTGFA